MTRARRYLIIAGLLLIAVAVAFTFQIVRTRLPNLLDQEQVDALEIEGLKAASLQRPTTAGTDWPQYRGVNRDGYAPFADTAGWDAATFEVKWTAEGGAGYSSLAISGGRVYTQDKLGGEERIRCLDAKDGKELWGQSYPVDYSGLKAGFAYGPRATPTIQDGRLYAVAATGQFRCLQLPATEGGLPTLLWEHDLLTEFRGGLPTWGVACSPLIEADAVIVQPGGKDGSVVAFDRVTGKKKWAVGSDPSGYSSPVVADLGGVRQVVAITGKTILGIRPADGTKLWEQPWETQHFGNIAMPVIAGDYVFVSSNYGKGCVLLHVTAGGAKVVYFRKGRVMANHHSTCIHRDGRLFGYDGSTLKCINLRDGTEVDDWPTDATIRNDKGSLILVGDYLIGQSEKGSLFLTKADATVVTPPARGFGILDGPECWASPAFADGRLYLRDSKKVVCVEIRGKK